MNPSQPFILRPVATTLLMIAIMLSGMLAFRFLPVAALPEADYPTIQVQTFYPGASPDVMTSSVTAPLEVQFGQMPNLNQMSSVSSAGASVITLQFGLTISLDVAEQEVQAAINAAGNLLPADLPAPPIYAKVNPADAPILTLGLTSKTMPLTQVEDFVDTRLAQKISQLPGVGLVSISGGQKPAVRIRADIRKLAKEYNIPIQQVPPEKLHSFTRANHQGVIAFAALVTYMNLQQVIDHVVAQGGIPLFVMLDGVSDVRNIGAIARSVLCCGAQALIIPDKGTGALNEEAIKSSAGALEKIHVCRVGSLADNTYQARCVEN